MDTTRTIRTRNPFRSIRVASRALLSRKYVWLWNAPAGKAVEYAAACRVHGFDGIILKAHDGTSLYNAATIEEYTRDIKAAGLKLGLWGYLRATFPQAEALLAATLCQRYNADFYVADAEIEYEKATQPVSRMFLTEFRKHCPRLKGMLTSFGRVDFHRGIDWAAWAKHDFRFAPQAYYNDSRDLLPQPCADAAVTYFPRAYIHPVIPAYKGALGRPIPEESAAILAPIKRYGFSVWAGDFMLPNEWKVLGGI